jgi:thiol oxidase
MLESDIKEMGSSDSTEHLKELQFLVNDPEFIRPMVSGENCNENANLSLLQVLRSLSAAVENFTHKQTSEQSDGEMKLTMLLTWTKDGTEAVDGSPFTVFSHVAVLPDRPARPIKVEVKGAPRMNAKAKDSEWVRQRQALESSMGAGVNEIILMDHDGGLPEGTQTNFFALQQGSLVTAGDGVLEGTVRKLVLQVGGWLC